jgi:hypothetical protein
MLRCCKGLAAVIVGLLVTGAGQVDARGGKGGGNGQLAGKPGPQPNHSMQGSNNRNNHQQHHQPNGNGRGRHGKQMTQKERNDAIAGMANRLPLTQAQQGAVNNLLSGAPLTQTDRNVLNTLATEGQGLTDEERQAILQGLDADQARTASDNPSGGGVKQVQRYLTVYNTTGEPVTVYLQCRIVNRQGDWTWFPAQPGDQRKALTYQLEPGKAGKLKLDGNLLAASKVRLWAVSQSGSRWEDFREQDLWLVPEKAANGEHYYLAGEVGTVSLRISPPDASGKLQTIVRK